MASPNTLKMDENIPRPTSFLITPGQPNFLKHRKREIKMMKRGNTRGKRRG